MVAFCISSCLSHSALRQFLSLTLSWVSRPLCPLRYFGFSAPPLLVLCFLAPRLGAVACSSWCLAGHVVVHPLARLFPHARRVAFFVAPSLFALPVGRGPAVVFRSTCFSDAPRPSSVASCFSIAFPISACSLLFVFTCRFQSSFLRGSCAGPHEAFCVCLELAPPSGLVNAGFSPGMGACTRWPQSLFCMVLALVISLRRFSSSACVALPRSTCFGHVTLPCFWSPLSRWSAIVLVSQLPARTRSLLCLFFPVPAIWLWACCCAIAFCVPGLSLVVGLKSFECVV